MVRFSAPPPQQNLPAADNTTFNLLRDLAGHPDDAAATTETDRKTFSARLRGALAKLIAIQAQLDSGATSSQASEIITRLDTIDNFVDTEIATIISALGTIDDFLDTEIAAILAAVDTEVAAIKTVTDLLQSWTQALNTGPSLANNTNEQDLGEVTGLSAIPRRFLVELNLNNLTAAGTLRFYTAPDGANYSRVNHLSISIPANGISSSAVSFFFLTSSTKVKVTFQADSNPGTPALGLIVHHRKE